MLEQLLKDAAAGAQGCLANKEVRSWLLIAGDTARGHIHHLHRISSSPQDPDPSGASLPSLLTDPYSNLSLCYKTLLCCS